MSTSETFTQQSAPTIPDQTRAGQPQTVANLVGVSSATVRRYAKMLEARGLSDGSSVPEDAIKTLAGLR